MTTLRAQLTRRLLLAAALLLLLGGLAVYLCARTALLAQFEAALRAKAEALAALTEMDGRRLETEFSQGRILGFGASEGDFFELWLAPSLSVDRSRSLAGMHLPLRHGRVGEAVFWNLTLPDTRRGRAVGLRFSPHGANPPAQTAILVVASDRRDLDRALTTLELVLALGGLALLAVTVVAVPRVLRHGLQPLDNLADEASRIDAGSLAARFSTEALPGELAPIAASLNGLLTRLEESFARERQFSSDVAHEFRTPVAELRVLSELALKLPDTRTAETDRETLAISLHLESILTRLLALARGERPVAPARVECVDVAALLRSICETFSDRAALRKLDLTLRIPPAAPTETDPVLLQAILTNLVDNAIAYTPEGGEVTVELDLESGRLAVRVINTVTNLVASDLPQMFERFWRKDAARSSDGHTGLGLSLARTFAEAIRFELTARLEDPSRVVFELRSAE